MGGFKTFVYLLLLISLNHVHATSLSHQVKYYPEKFYDDVRGGMRDSGLKSALYEVLSRWHKADETSDQILEHCSSAECYQHITLGYRRARQILFGELHLEQGNNDYSIVDVYCERRLGRNDFKRNPPGPGKIPDPTILNAEHTWPQSRFTGKYDPDMQKSDLHILYPVFSEANSSRGNIEFSDVITPVTTPCAKSQRGYSTDGGNQHYFEVPQGHKGNVARAIFYFSTRYRTRVAPHEEASLRAWHQSDPVDDREMQRNEAIFKWQKVRNPFIDHPELVELISDF